MREPDYMIDPPDTRNVAPVFECGHCGYVISLDTAEPMPLFHEFCDGPLCEECYEMACDAEDRGRAL